MWQQAHGARYVATSEFDRAGCRHRITGHEGPHRSAITAAEPAAGQLCRSRTAGLRRNDRQHLRTGGIEHRREPFILPFPSSIIPLRDRQAHRQDPWERVASKASRATSATSSPPTRAPRPPPTAASSSPGSARRASMPTTSTAIRLEGRSRPRRHGRLRHSPTTSGARRARRSSGTAWSSCSATRRRTRSCSRSTPRPARRSGRPIGRSCRRGARRRRHDAAPGPELVTNASNFVRGYDPKTGKELWRLGGSSKITAPTPIFADGLIVVASGRAPERPVFAVRPGARGDLTLANGRPSSDAVAWSKTGRGSYMPTPLVYDGILYVLATTACSMPTSSRPARRSTASGSDLSAAASARHRSRPTEDLPRRAKTATSS